jgi:hypothetical protein
LWASTALQYFEPQKQLNFDFNADPDPASKNNADACADVAVTLPDTVPGHGLSLSQEKESSPFSDTQRYTHVFAFYRLRVATAHCTLHGTELNEFVLLGLSLSSCVDGTAVSGLAGTWIYRAVM